MGVDDCLLDYIIKVAVWCVLRGVGNVGRKGLNWGVAVSSTSIGGHADRQCQPGVIIPIPYRSDAWSINQGSFSVG